MAVVKMIPQALHPLASLFGNGWGKGAVTAIATISSTPASQGIKKSRRRSANDMLITNITKV